MKKRSRFGRKPCPVCGHMVTKCAHARARHVGSKKCLDQAGPERQRLILKIATKGI